MRINVKDYKKSWGKESTNTRHSRPDFRVGDNVICVGPETDNERVVGLFGVVVVSSPGHLNIGVKFSEEMGGHTLDGQVRDGFGYWVHPGYLIHEWELDSCEKKITVKLGFDSIFGG